ncbi:maleylpyruvate isomerase N-terminal domain-containing protein [Streptomyces sp. 5-10]|nr:maleylpyruvate isomerase N-terminal domain-containing protein [Streptomyces sp. 5-10]
MTDVGFARPSALPGWSRAHLVAHVARDADALVNLLNWARTGVETSMYASADQRAREIEEDARRRPEDLRAELLAADGRAGPTLRSWSSNATAPTAPSASEWSSPTPHSAPSTPQTPCSARRWRSTAGTGTTSRSGCTAHENASAEWASGKWVLLGDAAHTAHFSVGSGTKMAMEDAVAPAEAPQETPDGVPEALRLYEEHRRPKVEKIQNSARPSLSWWEHFGRYVRSFDDPTQFAFHFLTRSIPRGKLAVRDAL